MMKQVMVFIGIICSVYLNAQTGIGTTTPDPSAKLEVASSNKGFLPPRVSLTATNSSSPITNPANGLLVFNTVTAGANPFQVVPGYYYWDGTGQKWVSLSTTVGNVQNQAIFRSSGITYALNAVSTWASSFNNIAVGDLAIGSSTTFTLSNGFYKLEWALPYQPTGTYNDMLLQENISGTWSTFRGNDIYARIANGGSGNWGGTTFAADVVDCSTSSKTFRLYNADGASRALYAGATFIITKLNPSITTSTTADNLGNHIATNNIQLNGNYLSNDGGNEGIRVDNSGNVGIGTITPTAKLEITGDLKVSGSSNTNYLAVGTGIGDEGGELSLALAQTNQSLNTNVVVDIFRNSLRIFEGGGSNRGVSIDLSKAPNGVGGELLWKASGIVNAGVDVTLGNLKVRFSTSGMRSIQLSTVTGSYSLQGSCVYVANGVGYVTYQDNNRVSVTTTPANLSGLNFTAGGQMETWILTDVSSSIGWRITSIVGSGFANNFITIERLL